MAKVKNFFKSKKNWKSILLITLSCILLVGAIVGIASMFREKEENTKVINPTFAVGGLTEQGGFLDTESSIYTKDAFSCKNVDVKITFNNDISYRLFFYDENDDYLSSTYNLRENYDETTTPLMARTCRIVITPQNDDKISWYEINGYAKQIEISVDKEQDFTMENLFVARLDKTGVLYKNVEGTNLFDDTQLTSSEGFGVSELFDVTDIKTLKVTHFAQYTNRPLLFTDADGIITSVARMTQVLQDDGSYVAIVSVPQDAVYCATFFNLGDKLPIINAIEFR